MPYAEKTWREINSALRMCDVSETDRAKLESKMKALTDKQQDAAVRRGLFSGLQSNDSTAVVRRDYFRAWHFLNALIVIDQKKQMPSSDPDTTQRARYQSPSAVTVDRIREELRALVADALGKTDAPIEEPKIEEVRIVPTAQAPITASSQLAMAKVVTTSMLVNKAAKKFSGLKHGNLVKEVAHFKMDNLRADWDAERNNIDKEFTRQMIKLAASQTAMTKALGDAYAQFELTMKDVQKAKQAKLDMAASAFAVLAKLPTPFDTIGKVGSAIVKQLKVSPIEDLTREVVRPPELRTPAFSQKVMAKVNELSEKKDEFMTVGVSMRELEKPAELSSLLFDVVRSYMVHLESEVNKELDEQFGKKGKQDDKLKAYVDAKAVTAVTALDEVHKLRIGHIVDRTDNLLSKSVAQARVHELVKGELVGFAEGIREDLEKRLLKFEFTALNSDDMRCLIELYLIGGYVMAEYRRAKMKYGDMKLEDALILRLQRQGTWGFLSATGEHHSDQYNGRLVWKGKENHYRALVYFIRYFRASYHPFDLLRGVQTIPDGKLITAQRINEDLHAYVDKLSRKIDETRTKGRFGSTWNWTKVDQAMGPPPTPETRMNQELALMRAQAMQGT